MSLSKQSEKYWQRGDNFGACVSQLFSRGKNDRLGENVSQLYSEEIFSEDTSAFVFLCSSKQQENFPKREKIKPHLQQCTYERFFMTVERRS